MKMIIQKLLNRLSSKDPFSDEMNLILSSYIAYDWSQWNADSTLWDFTEWLDENRMIKSLVFVPRVMPPLLYGAWLTSESKEYVFYDINALPGHKEHIILHEVCHILLNHKTKKIPTEQGDFFASRPPTCPEVGKYLVKYARWRKHLDVFESYEQEAETLAKLIQEKMISLVTPTPTVGVFRSYFGAINLR